MRISLDLPDDAVTVPLCRGVLRDLAVEPDRAADIELVLSKATGNVIRHAYAQPGHQYRVEIEVNPERAPPDRGGQRRRVPAGRRSRAG